MYLGRIPLCLENLVGVGIFMSTSDTETPEGSSKPLKSPLIATLKAFLKDLTLFSVTNLEVLILNRVENSI